MEPPTLRLYQLTKNLTAKITPHLYSTLRDLGVIINKSILYRSPILAGADRSGTSDLLYGTKNEHNNTQNDFIEGDIRRYVTVDTDQKYQGKVETADNMLCKLKQIYQLNKWNDDMVIPDVEEVSYVSSYPLI